MDSELKCPRCGTTKYRNPSLKLMVNVCGHRLCENCVELLFLKGSGACPKCGITLRKNHFRLQLFDDDFVEKEIDIRKRILKDYNKKEDDFDTLYEYNDYLEEIETIIFNLSNDIDVESTKRKIENYKKDNAIIIAKNRNKLSRDELFIEEILEQEKDDTEIKKQLFMNEEKEFSRTKTRLKEDLVDELMFSDRPANQIYATHLNKQQKINEEDKSRVSAIAKPKHSQMFSTGIKVGRASDVTFDPIPKTVENVMFEYTSPHIDINGPNLPELESLDTDGYLRHVRSTTDAEKAGGFLPQYPCYRALQESFCGLYFEVTN